MSKLQKLLEPVEKIPIGILLKEEYQTLGRNSHVIVVGEGKNRIIVNNCSEDYALVKNATLIGLVEEALSDYETETFFSIKNRSRFYFDFIIKNKAVNIQKGDPVSLSLKVQNSYDGRLRFNYSFGVYRLVCSNRLSVMDENGLSISAMHTPQIEDSTLVDDIREKTAEIITGFKDLVEPFKELAKAKAPKDKEGVIDFMKELTEGTRFPKRGLEIAADIALDEAIKLNLEMNNWLVYNALNQVLFREGDSNMDEHKKQRVDREILRGLL